jgi:tetratricopeptide (TPR) repeat protein
VAVIFVLTVAVFGWRWAGRKINERSFKQAAEFMSSRDFRSAQLTLEQMVQGNPQNQEARRALAEFYTQLGNPRALTLWDELLAREPDNDAYVIGKAGIALQLKRYDIVESSLARVSPAGRAEAVYKRHRAALALVTGDQAALASELGALAVLEPDDARMQFNSAAAAAYSQDRVTASAARVKLLALAQTGSLRIRATLQLIRLAESQPNPGRAMADLAGAVLKLSPARKAGFFELAEHMKADALPMPADAADLVEWMAGRGLAREALLWVSGLSAATQNSPQVLRARAVCAVQLQDWVRLQQLLQSGAWGAIPSGALELAFAARVQKDGTSRLRAMETWEDALTLAAKNGGAPAFHGLERLAGLWGWPEARAKTLWTAHKSSPRDLAYLRKLAADAEEKGDVEQLGRIYDEWMAAYPDDRFAGASRLYLKVLNGGMDAAARKQAASLIDRPDVLPEEAVIWAWAETRDGGGAAALARLVPMIPGIRLRPRAALVYGALLAEEGRSAEALEFLSISASQKMLPEERALLQRSKDRLDQK